MVACPIIICIVRHPALPFKADSLCLRAASRACTNPTSWSEAANKLITAANIATAASLPNDPSGLELPPSAGSSAGNLSERERYLATLGPRRKFPAVAENSKEADGAVPATLLGKLAKPEVARIEQAAAATISERNPKQEVRRVVDTHGNEAWSVVFSGGKSLGTASDSIAIAGPIIDAHDNLAIDIDNELIYTYIGPSTRLQSQLKTQTFTTRNAILSGCFEGHLESIVQVLGSTPSSGDVVEAGANPNDPSAGRAGSLDKLYIQSDMPRALTNLARMLNTYHGEAGGAVAATDRDKDFGLLRLWTAAGVLPLLTTKMRCGTEVVGSIRLVEEVLRRWTRLLREKRRKNIPTPVNFQDAVDWVFEKELTAAVTKQHLFSYMSSSASHHAAGKRQGEDSGKDKPAKSHKPTAQAPAGAAPSSQKQAGSSQHAERQPYEKQNTPPAPPHWWPLAPGKITHVCNPSGANPIKPNLISSAEYLFAQHCPTLRSNQLPCAWAFCLTAGCTKKNCARCENTKELAKKRQGAHPLPPNLRKQIRDACTPAIAELMRKDK